MSYLYQSTSVAIAIRATKLLMGILIDYSDETRPVIPDETRPLLAMDNMVQR